MQTTQPPQIDTSDLTADQKQAFDTLMAGKNVFLTGNAGTGKSYVLDKFIDYLDEAEIPHLALAPTGVAALNIKGGSTIHRTLKLPIGFLDPNEKLHRYPAKVLSAARIIIIDEISMLRIDLFERVMKLIRKAERSSTTKQVVLVGDFFQLPPVVTEDEERLMMRFYPGNTNGWCFMSDYWRGYNFKPCVLKTVVRQDNPEYIHNLDLAREGDTSCISYFNQHAVSSRKYVKNASDTIFLCNTNSAAKKINNEEMAKLKQSTYKFTAAEDGTVNTGDKKAEEELSLCVGARVMALINDNQDRFINGSQGEATEINSDKMIVKVRFFESGEEVEIKPFTWRILKSKAVTKIDDEGREVVAVETETIGKFRQFPLKLAYAITVHKSQGLTFSGKVALNTNTFSAGQLYVGLSRCESIDNLTVFPKIEPKRLQASREVVEFYDNLDNQIEQEQAQAQQQPLQQSSAEVTAPPAQPQFNNPNPSLETDIIECPKQFTPLVKQYIEFLKQGVA